VAIAKIEPPPKFGLASELTPWEQRYVEGKALRRAVPRESHTKWEPGRRRPDPMALMAQSNKGRQPHLVPLRWGAWRPRPLRSCGARLASWLPISPRRITVVMDGDAHVNNFGFCGTPQREVVCDLNDFDEAVVGP
jgi:Uncharacterized protein conserved in bacteria (DUF2252)